MTIRKCKMNIKGIIYTILHPIVLIQKKMPGGVLNDKTVISILYKKRFKRKINLFNPQSFNEKLHWLTIHDRRPEYTTMVDKYRAKKLISSLIGEKYVVENLGAWKSSKDIDFNTLPEKYVLKCNHDSGSVVICNNRLPSKDELRMLDKALHRNYYYFSREWPYKNVEPIIFAEKYIEAPSKKDGGIIDYKLYCFNGTPYMFCVISNREVKANLTFVTLEWNRINVKQRYDNHEVVPNKPYNLDKMIEIGKVISKGIPFLRVDFFETLNHHLYVGELTFTPSSGLIPFEPDVFDYELGALLKIDNL